MEDEPGHGVQDDLGEDVPLGVGHVFLKPGANAEPAQLQLLPGKDTVILWK